jgi:hypothetical protein
MCCTTVSPVNTVNIRLILCNYNTSGVPRIRQPVFCFVLFITYYVAHTPTIYKSCTQYTNYTLPQALTLIYVPAAPPTSPH